MSPQVGAVWAPSADQPVFPPRLKSPLFHSGLTHLASLPPLSPTSLRARVGKGRERSRNKSIIIRR